MMMKLNRILCIDDDIDILEVAKMCLETIGGYTVECCNSGQSALWLVQEYTPDLILLDYMMPEMDGPATMQALREIERLDNTPIAFMTARVQPGEVEEYLSLGATAVVPKPFNPMSLADEVDLVWRDAMTLPIVQDCAS